MTGNFLADDARNRSVTLWYVLTGKFTFHKRTEKHIENNQSCVACTSKLTTTWVDEPKSEDNGNRGHTGPWWTINARRNICTIRPVGMSKKFRHGSSSSKTWQTKYERERPRGVTLNLTTFREQAGVLHILLKCQFEYWQYFSITKGNHRDPYTTNKSLRMSAPLQIHNTR